MSKNPKKPIPTRPPSPRPYEEPHRVVFSEEQRGAIRQLVAAGNALGAQKAILRGMMVVSPETRSDG